MSAPRKPDYASYPGEYGGVKPEHPELDSQVVIVTGPFTGVIATVRDLRGHAFHHFYRVYVDTGDGKDLWFWPWELSPLVDGRVK